MSSKGLLPPLFGTKKEADPLFLPSLPSVRSAREGIPYSFISNMLAQPALCTSREVTPRWLAARSRLIRWRTDARTGQGFASQMAPYAFSGHFSPDP